MSDLEEDLPQLFKEKIAQTSQYPFTLEVESGTGSYLDTKQGLFLDFMAGIAVNNLGYRNPAVMDAIIAQVHNYSHVHVFGEYVQAPQVRLATEVLDDYPEGYQIFFTNSGTESTELALKMAAKVTGRHEFVAFRNGLHGRTTGALSVSDKRSYREGFPLLKDVNFLDYNSLDSLDSMFSLDWQSTAAVILELVQNGSGYTPATREFYHHLMYLSDQFGFKVIVDEIQTGMGRTSDLYAWQSYVSDTNDYVPDYVCLGKAFGGGLPLGAVIAPMGDFEKLQTPPISHATTFGGNPVCCAAALASLYQIQTPSFLSRVKYKGDYLKSSCEQMVKDFELVLEETRGKGLMRSLIFTDPKHVNRFVRGCYEKKLLVGLGVTTSKYVRLTPPLNVTDEQLFSAVLDMREVLTEMMSEVARVDSNA